VEPDLYADASCADALNDAQRQAAIRKRLILDQTTDDLCVFAVTAVADDTGSLSVAMHPRMLAVRTARWSLQTCGPLRLTTLKVMDRDHPTWPATVAGTPTHLIVDCETGKVNLWPTPDASGTLTLSVWRAPLEEEECEATDFDLDPVIDEVFHRDLLDWAEHWLYLTKDGENGDPQRATAAEQRFTAKFGRLPTAHEIKCWGLGKGRGQVASFI
jgi:hypothetical protein